MALFKIATFLFHWSVATMVTRGANEENGLVLNAIAGFLAAAIVFLIVANVVPGLRSVCVESRYRSC